MNQDVVFRFAEVTEAAALAGFKWLGRGDKNAADNAAVEAMRQSLGQLAIDGEIVIGEGEIDEAPMLYIGERVGCGGVGVDIAVDPIDGTRMTAMGQGNALAVLAVGEKGAFLKAPDMYMEKLVVGPSAKGVIDLNLPLLDNLKAIAQAKGKPLNELSLITLAKPRHQDLIHQLQDLGIRVFAIPDGDVAASVLTCLPERNIDVMYCIGGAPEGVVSAAVVRALGGDMQARLLARHQVKGDTDENRAIGEHEIERCLNVGVPVESVLPLERLVKNDRVVFSATGVTAGDLLAGIRHHGQKWHTETLLVDGLSGRVRRIHSTHRQL
ncbi:MAG: Fructose-1,6-bisphosphatase 1 class 2 [Candidatus Celerinatantimonas neptuna]|nr:MAG: Fructose-1,6-bisphosphatase 1 class 2 [Candidatus Celerinatantimonas neptuna]